MGQGLQARGAEEEQEMEAELSTDLNSRDAPFHEALRVLRVPQGHAAVRRWRRVDNACRSFWHRDRLAPPADEAFRSDRVARGHAAARDRVDDACRSSRHGITPQSEPALLQRVFFRTDL